MVEAVVAATALTSCPTSSVIKPFALIRGVTFRMTPVSTYCTVFTIGASGRDGALDLRRWNRDRIADEQRRRLMIEHQQFGRRDHMHVGDAGEQIQHHIRIGAADNVVEAGERRPGWPGVLRIGVALPPKMNLFSC